MVVSKWEQVGVIAIVFWCYCVTHLGRPASKILKFGSEGVLVTKRHAFNFHLPGIKLGGATGPRKWQFSYISSAKKDGFPNVTDRSCPFALQLAFGVKRPELQSEIAGAIRGRVIRNVQNCCFPHLYCALVLLTRNERLGESRSVTNVHAVAVSVISDKSSWWYRRTKLVCGGKFASLETPDGTLWLKFLTGILRVHHRICVKHTVWNVLFDAYDKWVGQFIW